jgi:23S rRNA A2030 N6-methylase RlmJ
MAHGHFGEIGDVWKHLVLAELLAIAPPRRYWESHAGSATHQLTRSWEREYGVYRFFAHASSDPILASSRYLGLLGAQEVVDGGPVRYLGSASMAMAILGEEAVYLLCDLDPASVSSLAEAAREFDVDDVARSICGDGLAAVWEAARSLSAGQASGTFTLIDPDDTTLRTVEGMDALDLFARLAVGGSQVMLWYRYDSFDERRAQLDRVAGVPGTAVYAADLATSYVRGDTGLNSGAPGFGILLANHSDVSVERVEALGEALGAIYADALMPDGTPGDLQFAMIRAG